MQIFYRAPAGCTAERKTESGQEERQRKRNMGLVYTVIWCAQTPTPPPPLPYLAGPTSPAYSYGYQGRSYSGEPPPSPPLITHTPFQQLEATAVDL
jgi:hypothetical protein